jgi:hypothetical protein
MHDYMINFITGTTEYLKIVVNSLPTFYSICLTILRTNINWKLYKVTQTFCNTVLLIYYSIGIEINKTQDPHREISYPGHNSSRHYFPSLKTDTVSTTPLRRNAPARASEPKVLSGAGMGGWRGGWGR